MYVQKIQKNSDAILHSEIICERIRMLLQNIVG